MRERTPASSEAHVATTLAIVLLAALAGLSVEWQLPGLGSYAQDLLTRARGPLPVPDDIAIIAIDEPSIARFGRFPWPRPVMARVLDAVAAAQPKAIAVDVLYTDPTTPEEDAALERSIAHAGNVVVAAQLVDGAPGGSPAAWLRPLPSLASAAAGVGHVNVLTESDGAARQMNVAAVDDAGQWLRAMPIEAIRVGERVPEQGVADTGRSLVIGSRAIPLERGESPVVLHSPTAAGQAPEFLRAGRVAIDYIGPTGAFSPVTYSAVSLLSGAVPPGSLRGRYVLVGATAGALGERFPSPFQHHADVRGMQHGTSMPGVEVLANALNTILRQRFYYRLPGWLAFVWALLAAALTLAALRSFPGRYPAARQLGALLGVFLLLLAAALVAFQHFLVVAPVAGLAVSFASAGLLGLFRRSLATSSRLDAGLADMARAGELLRPPVTPDSAAEILARITGAEALAVCSGSRDGRYLPVAHHGAPLAARFSAGRAVAIDPTAATPSDFFLLASTRAEACRLLFYPISDTPHALAIVHPADALPSAETLLLSEAIASSYLAAIANARELTGLTGLWPRRLEDKARALSRLNAGLLDQARFVELALGSVEDGLVIAGPDGRIAYANRRAAEILDSTSKALEGRNFFERLAECEQSTAPNLASLLTHLLLDRRPVEREIAIRAPRIRQYILRLSAVASPDGPVRGIVASISDITRQKELQQTKNDVIALVSHEMRTPLAAVQGMSELLANYELEPQRRREMSLAINDEVKRLTRMITEYLNITRLESGATTLRRAPVRLAPLVERTLLLLEPLAAERSIRLRRVFADDIPALMADADLLTRAVENLVSNAIKYSPAGREVTVSVETSGVEVAIVVADQGYGIPAADQERIFEKFYRVPRLQDADVTGTGLGLALVREIAELHGGSISVRSEVHTGSTFTLRLNVEGPRV
jgi:PAS domain S-box-containing protein